MEQYISKSALVEEITRIKGYYERLQALKQVYDSHIEDCNYLLSFLATLEVKEVDLELEQRIKECPFRQVVCNKYENTPVECDCNCSWVVDYPKLKELKAQKEK